MLESRSSRLATPIYQLKQKMANRCRFAISDFKNQPLSGLNFTRAFAAAFAFPLVALGRELMLFNVATIPLVPPVEHWAGDEDRGERSGKDTDDEDEGEISDDSGAEDVKRESRKQCGDTREQCAREHTAERQIDNRA